MKSKNKMAEPDPSIRFITRKWAPAMGGMETYCIRLVEGLQKNNIVELYSLPGQEGGQAPTGLQYIGFGVRTFWRLLWAKSVPIVHVSDLASWPLAWVAKIRRPKSRVYISVHGSDISLAERSGLKAKIYKMYIRMAARLLGRTHLIANSNYIAGLLTKYGFKSISVVPLATEIQAETVPIASGDHLFFAGRIMPGKGIGWFIQNVLPIIPGKPTLRVAGTIWDEAEAQHLKSANVEYLGRLDSSGLTREYQEAMCVIVPSHVPEGFGLVAAEAAASGGVVVASNHSGLAEVCTKDHGFLAAIDEPQAWVDAINHIQEWSPQERQAFVERSMDIARNRFSWARVAKDTQAIYKQGN